MSALPQIFGNSETIAFFEKAIAEKKLAHAYIIEGSRGSGKSTLVRSLCVMISGNTENGSMAEKIISGACPDVSEYSIPEKKKFIPIESIREIKAAAYIKPSELDVRIFIINDADMMTIPGQNALLKLLEEPPNNVFIFLLCENSAGLLPTVRSRASIFRMQRFTQDEMVSYLSSLKKYSEEEIRSAANKADGCIGRATDFLSSKNRKNENDLVEKIIFSVSNGDFPSLISSCNALSNDKSELSRSLALLDTALRDMILASIGKTTFSYYSSSDEAIKSRGMLTKKSLIMMRECISTVRSEINYNPNIQTVKSIIAKRLMRAARG